MIFAGISSTNIYCSNKVGIWGFLNFLGHRLMSNADANAYANADADTNWIIFFLNLNFSILSIDVGVGVGKMKTKVLSKKFSENKKYRKKLLFCHLMSASAQKIFFFLSLLFFKSASAWKKYLGADANATLTLFFIFCQWWCQCRC